MRLENRGKEEDRRSWDEKSMSVSMPRGGDKHRSRSPASTASGLSHGCRPGAGGGGHWGAPPLATGRLQVSCSSLLQAVWSRGNHRLGRASVSSVKPTGEQSQPDSVVVS